MSLIPHTRMLRIGDFCPNEFYYVMVPHAVTIFIGLGLAIMMGVHATKKFFTIASEMNVIFKISFYIAFFAFVLVIISWPLKIILCLTVSDFAGYMSLMIGVLAYMFIIMCLLLTWIVKVRQEIQGTVFAVKNATWYFMVFFLAIGIGAVFVGQIGLTASWIVSDIWLMDESIILILLAAAIYILLSIMLLVIFSKILYKITVRRSKISSEMQQIADERANEDENDIHDQAILAVSSSSASSAVAASSSGLVQAQVQSQSHSQNVQNSRNSLSNPSQSQNQNQIQLQNEDSQSQSQSQNKSRNSQSESSISHSGHSLVNFDPSESDILDHVSKYVGLCLIGLVTAICSITLKSLLIYFENIEFGIQLVSWFHSLDSLVNFMCLFLQFGFSAEYYYTYCKCIDELCQCVMEKRAAQQLGIPAGNGNYSRAVNGIQFNEVDVNAFLNEYNIHTHDENENAQLVSNSGIELMQHIPSELINVNRNNSNNNDTSSNSSHRSNSQSLSHSQSQSTGSAASGNNNNSNSNNSNRNSNEDDQQTQLQKILNDTNLIDEDEEMQYVSGDVLM